MKRILVFILMIGLLLSSFNFEVFASGINSEQEFFNYLDSIGQEKTTEKGKVANYLTYKKYNLIVYGSPWGDTKPTGIGGYTGTQYRYLGYTLEDEAYTNPYFPPDETSGNKPEQFNYIKVANARESWRVITDEAQREHMLNSPMSGNGATSLSFTLNSIGGIEYGKLLSASTWKSQGSVYLQHRGASGKIWYITETFTAMVGDTIVTGKISTPSNTYYIKKDETEAKIPVTVTAEAVKSGRADDKHIRNISASFQGNSSSQKFKSTATVNSNFIATRANYTVGTHQIKLEGTFSLSTIFNDNDSSNVSKTITLIVEAEGDSPYVTTTVTPDPAEKKFEGKDIDVVLTVNAELHNYTKTSNIKEWVFYAREKEETKALEKKVYAKSLNASTTFKFTIPKEKIKDDNFKQYYVVQARAYFNQKVNGKDYENYPNTPVETFVSIFKNEPAIPKPDPKPPISYNIPPTTNIFGPKIVEAGDRVKYTAQSADEDGYIVSAYFASGVIGGRWDDETPEGGTAYSFNKIFSADDIGKDIFVTHWVKDNDGDDGWDLMEVDVIAPKPKASLSFNGKFKENRIVTMKNTSSSPGSPLVDSKTKITITPDGDGATNNIIYSGTLTDNLIKDLKFRDKGNYKFDIYVENENGDSDSAIYYISIEPDIPPVAEYSIDSKIYRDKNDSNFAIMEIINLSFSPDNDKIVEKTWTITYNANNNKDSESFPNYTDDTSFQVKDSELELFVERSMVKGGFTYKFMKTAEDTLTIKANQVGNYLIELMVKEDYGLEGNTSQKHKMEKTITIYNREPFVDFEP